MLVQEILQIFYKLVSNNSSFKKSFKDLEFYFDVAIDNVNNYLKTSYLTIRELYEANKYYYNGLWQDDFKGVLDNDSDLIDKENGLYLIKCDSKFYRVSELYGEKCFKKFESPLSLPNGKTYKDFAHLINYNEFADYYQRSVLAYSLAYLFLEEEDELESQYARYKEKVVETLSQWRRIDFSLFTSPGRWF